MQDLIDTALGHHRAGRLDLAVPLYAEALRHRPDHPEALHLMGVVSIQTGRFADAVDWIARALAARPDFPEAHNNLGNVFRALGQPDQAAIAFGKALELRPDFPEALNNLGVCRQTAGDFADAADLFRRACDLRPTYPEAAINLAQVLEQAGRMPDAAQAYGVARALVPDNADLHNLHGNVLRGLGEITEAAEAYADAVRSQPDSIDFKVNLGVALTECRRLSEAVDILAAARGQAPDHARAAIALGVALMLHGQTEDAIICLQDAVALAPGLAATHGNLGLALARQGKLDEAADCQRAALRLQPDNAIAHNNLATIMTELGQWDAAMAAVNQALALRPAFAEAHMARGALLKATGRLDEAEAALRDALALAPNSPEAHTALGSIHQLQWRLDEAEACHRTALALWPDFSAAEINLGATLQILGRAAEAAECYERILARHPEHFVAFGSLLNATMYRDDLSTEQVTAIHRRFGAAMARPPLVEPPLLRPTATDSDRRLRIGYLSSDLREHPVATNLLPIIRHHDRSRFSIHFYAHVARPDALTDEFRRLGDGWCDIRGLTDRQAAERIRMDGIDILVSLAGRFDLNRPGICGWRAAPVQINMYDVATNGMAEHDYIIGDLVLIPKGTVEYFSERPLRLPSIYVADFPNLPPLPASPRQGPAIFNCFNNPAKISSTSLALWGKILATLPQGRLILKYHQAYSSASLRERLLRELSAAGADRRQVDFITGKDSGASFLERYNQTDISLDTLPFSGATTSYQALCMGVPVLTLPSERMVGRWTTSMLRVVGLRDLIASSPKDFVSRAVAMANNIDAWRARRADIRESVRLSRLCDAAAWTGHLERLYRAAWRHACGI
ncbi:tetratricopeptide repeat protein [Paramagnetospirillum marisnigri]|uniref:tetratricopeptide repeat protein n=1 Tax=Paramagnetospirillum marisnigri TaxID=1285242 RepID=UPI000ADCEE5A|nr:tetratricopeptide repeat protein [Paramagnetospirillum marisnigri]